MVLTSHILWRPLVLPISALFQFLSNLPPPSCCLQPPPSPAHSVVFFLWLDGWSCHIWCPILLNDIIDEQTLNLRTLIHVLCNNLSSLLSSDMWLFAGTHTDTKRHTAHSGASRLIHPYKYIFTPTVMCS